MGLAALIGLVVGFAEVSILVIWHACSRSTVLGSLQMNRHYYWMIPAIHLTCFTAGALPLAVAAIVRPQWARRSAILLLSSLGFFALLLIIQGLYAIASGFLAVALGLQIMRRVRPDDPRLGRMVQVGLPVLLAGLGVVGLWRYNQVVLKEQRALAALPARPPGTPNVLLVVLDTVRADRLNLYGYQRATTPNLARLAGRGVVFGEARSAAPWTLPSHASMFTGRWPHELRVGGDRPLDGRYPTLAEYLAGHGYATAGFVSNTYFCNSWYGLDRGFAHYEDYYEDNLIVSPGEALRCAALGRWLIRSFGAATNARPETANTLKDARKISDDFLRWVEAHRDRPFFAFLNYMDAHDPYLPPAGYDRHFGLKPETPADIERIRRWHQVRPASVSKRDLTLIGDSYDDCLSYLDEQLGRLFDTLEVRGILRDTIVIVTADHGEQLGEHGLYGHGKSLYRAEVHVPLLVFGPAGIPVGRYVSSPVSLRDLAATVVDRLGLNADSPLPGHSLAHFWETAPDRLRDAEHSSPVLSEVAIRTKVSRSAQRAPAQRGPMSSLVHAGKVYIRDAAGREELYDLEGDRAEQENLAGSPRDRDVLEHCRSALRSLVPADTVRR
jgi:arylsulfatase A-like enzyme